MLVLTSYVPNIILLLCKLKTCRNIICTWLSTTTTSLWLTITILTTELSPSDILVTIKIILCTEIQLLYHSWLHQNATVIPVESTNENTLQIANTVISMTIIDTYNMCIYEFMKNLKYFLVSIQYVWEE